MVNALNFKAIGRGSLLGFFDLRYHGMTVKGCRLLEGQHGRFIGLPQNKSDKDGEPAFFDIIHITTPEREHITRLAIADLKAQGHLDRNPHRAKKRSEPEDEDLSAYKPKDNQDGIPF